MADQTTSDDSSTESERLDRVMVDIETLGLEPGSVIVSIGAVRFTPGDGPTSDQFFYKSIDIADATRYGLTIDGETLQWWLDQDEAVQAQLEGGTGLEDALTAFSEWYDGADEIWANSPAFDCTHLEHAYDAIDSEVPWEFYDERDYRTITNLPFDVDIGREGSEHDALNDAIHQARVASEIIYQMEMNEHINSRLNTEPLSEKYE